MKSKIFKHMIIAAIILMFVSISSKAESIAEEKTVEISLPTMQCNMCVENIETALKKVDGIINTKVDLENKKAIVIYDNSKTTLKKLQKTITNAGYNANDRKANKEAYENLHECCKKP